MNNEFIRLFHVKREGRGFKEWSGKIRGQCD